MKLLQLQLFSAFPRRKDRFLLGPEPSVDTQPVTKKSSIIKSKTVTFSLEAFGDSPCKAPSDLESNLLSMWSSKSSKGVIYGFMYCIFGFLKLGAQLGLAKPSLFKHSHHVKRNLNSNYLSRIHCFGAAWKPLRLEMLI